MKFLIRFSTACVFACACLTVCAQNVFYEVESGASSQQLDAWRAVFADAALTDAQRLDKLKVDKGPDDLMRAAYFCLFDYHGKNKADGALQWVRAKADDGNAQAQMMYAQLLIDGRRVKPNTTEAISLLEKAANGGSVEAMRQLMSFYEEGRVVAKDEAKVGIYRQMAVDANDSYTLLDCWRRAILKAKTPEELAEADQWVARIQTKYPEWGEYLRAISLLFSPRESERFDFREWQEFFLGLVMCLEEAKSSVFMTVQSMPSFQYLPYSIENPTRRAEAEKILNSLANKGYAPAIFFMATIKTWCPDAQNLQKGSAIMFPIPHVNALFNGNIELIERAAAQGHLYAKFVYGGMMAGGKVRGKGLKDVPALFKDFEKDYTPDRFAWDKRGLQTVDAISNDAEALDWLRQAAGNHEKEPPGYGCNIAEYFLWAYRVRPDATGIDAQEKLRIAQRVGDLYSVGMAYHEGIGVAKDPKAARESLDRAAKMGDVRAQDMMDAFYSEKDGGFYNPQKAARTMESRIAQGDAEAMMQLGLHTYKSQDPAQVQRAYECFRMAGEKGNPDGWYYLGLRYYYGDRCTLAQKRETLENFIKAADMGHLKAQMALGEIYYSGDIPGFRDGVQLNGGKWEELVRPLSFGESAKWYLRAAQQGDMSAINEIGKDYAGGRGLPRDVQKAYEWWSKGLPAKEGYSERDTRNEISYSLGVCHMEGLIANADPARAIALLAPISDDSIFARYRLGLCYLNGTGTSIDPQKAAECFKVKSSGGSLEKFPLFYENQQRMARRAMDVDSKYKTMAVQMPFYCKRFIHNPERMPSLDAQQRSQLSELAKTLFNDDLTSAQQCETLSRCTDKAVQAALVGQTYRMDNFPQGELGEFLMRWIYALAEQGDIQAQEYLGESFYIGRVVPKDSQQALQWLRKAVAQGSVPAKEVMAYVLLEGGGTQAENEEAFSYFTNLKKDSSVSSREVCLSICYEKGIGVKPDAAQALSILKGKYLSTGAQMRLGLLYLFGPEAIRDPARGVIFLEKNIYKNPEGAYHLGMCHLKGMGTLQDSVNGANYLWMAAKEGYAPAQYQLALCYAQGVGVPKDTKEARALFEAAARQGDVQAAQMLTKKAG